MAAALKGVLKTGVALLGSQWSRLVINNRPTQAPIPTSIVPQETDLVLFVGQTGAGKSQFVKDLSECFNSRECLQNSEGSMSTSFEKMVVMASAKSVTKVCMAYHLVGPKEGINRNLIVLDSPGFNDSDKVKMADTNICAHIAVMLKAFAEKGIQLKGVFYMVDVKVNRVFGTARGIMEILREMVGQSFLDSKRFEVITTHWDEVEKIGKHKVEQATAFEPALLEELTVPKEQTVTHRRRPDGLFSQLWETSPLMQVRAVMERGCGQGSSKDSTVLGSPIRILQELEENGNDITRTSAFKVADEVTGGFYALSELHKERAAALEEELKEQQSRVRRLETSLASREEREELKRTKIREQELERNLANVRKDAEKGAALADSWSSVFTRWLRVVGSLVVSVAVQIGLRLAGC